MLTPHPWSKVLAAPAGWISTTHFAMLKYRVCAHDDKKHGCVGKDHAMQIVVAVRVRSKSCQGDGLELRRGWRALTDGLDGSPGLA